ncbi:glycosyltransferase family 2 protein [Pseudoruegeria sp. SK021]|uniref:glycosyltransferase n=1 Tax=Pseudoruegeria sp. SK021 TaxID=1933035 RepID=UPI000A25BF7C|nr:glycosyltransferase [Pseudoruegeria sp. SK021]OSP55403.1 hypothetical protein BV911_07675 [Pseudoruegeria sp. SK021]
MISAQGRQISVIMPAYNAALLISDVLTPLLQMRESGELIEVIVVDDHSEDDTFLLARQTGATVVRTKRNCGPGAARNHAATIARGDILWFVDSDVLVAKESANQVWAAFNSQDVDAVFGSYDSKPSGKPWFSRYKNLSHHFYHQRANRESSTFWAGCGAIRADVFRKLGGFDVETYRVPSIEDIELGYRIKRAGGRILSMPDLQGKHLKVWTLKNGIFTDIFRRALPWSRLMMSYGTIENDLNVAWDERLKAVISVLFLSSAIIATFNITLLPFFIVFGVITVWCNVEFVKFFFRSGGFWFALFALSFHQFYYTYSSFAFAWCWVERHIFRVKARRHVP